MPKKTVKSIQEAIEDTRRRFIKAGIPTVNIVAAKARQNAQAEISRRFITRNNFTVNSVRFTQCPQGVSRIKDIKSSAGITDRAGYMARQETGGTRRSSSGANLTIPHTNARRGSNRNPVAKSYQFTNVKAKQQKRQSVSKMALAVAAYNAAKNHGFVRINNTFFKVERFMPKGDNRMFRAKPILNLKHRTTTTPQKQWLEPAGQQAAKDMQAIFNSQMDRLK